MKGIGLLGVSVAHVGHNATSMKGAHKIPRRHLASPIHHWKGRVLEFKLCKDGKRLAKVQHVYTASQLQLEEEQPLSFPSNYKISYLTFFIFIY